MRYRKMETNVKLVKQALARQEELLRKYKNVIAMNGDTSQKKYEGRVIDEMYDEDQIMNFIRKYPTLAQKHLPVLLLPDLYDCFDKIFIKESYVISKAQNDDVATAPKLYRRYYGETNEDAVECIHKKGNHTQREEIINIVTGSTDDIEIDANRYNSLQETVIINFLRDVLDNQKIDVQRNPISGRPSVHTCHTVTPIGQADIVSDCKLSAIFENIDDVNSAIGNRRFDCLVFLPDNKKLAIEVNSKQLHDKLKFNSVRRRIFQEVWNLTDEETEAELKKAAQIHNAMKNFVATSIGADYMEIHEFEIGCCEGKLKKKLEEMMCA